MYNRIKDFVSIWTLGFVKATFMALLIALLGWMIGIGLVWRDMVSQTAFRLLSRAQDAGPTPLGLAAIGHYFMVKSLLIRCRLCVYVLLAVVNCVTRAVVAQNHLHTRPDFLQYMTSVGIENPYGDQGEVE